MLKILTPKKIYKPASTVILDHKNAAESMFSPTLSVTPDTRKYISDLSKLPSSSEKSNIQHLNNDSSALKLRNKVLENQCIKLRNLLRKKRKIIWILKKKNLILLNDKKTKLNSQKFLESFKFQSISSKSFSFYAD